MTNNLHELEVKVAFLEESLSQLSEEFYRQQKELSALQSNYLRLVNKLQYLQESDLNTTETLDEKPPHY